MIKEFKIIPTNFIRAESRLKNISGKKWLLISTILVIFAGLFIFSFFNKPIYPNATISISKDTFSATESISIILDLKEKDTSVFPKAYGKENNENSFETEIVAPDKRTIRSVKPDFKELGDNRFQITAYPKDTLLPGKYTMNVILKKGVKSRVISQEFSWGVLALNFNKSVYSVGEKAYIQMGVVDENGDTICNTQLSLKITGENKKSIFLSTDEKNIFYQDSCGPNNVTSRPDYYAYFEFESVGKYNFELTATTKNGKKTISEDIEVSSNIPFDIERIGPPRIYPVRAFYPVVFEINADKDFKGKIIETLPLNFEVRKRGDTLPAFKTF